jgi:multiple sugar transport system permease protein
MRALRPAAAALAALLFLTPLVLMVTGSLREAGLPPPRGPELLPSPLAFDNYARAFELVDLGRYAANSLLVAAIAVPLSVLVASWAGFAIAQLPPRPARLLVAASFVAMSVPVTALLVPRFALFRALELTNTYVPLVAPALLGMSPFYVLLYAWAFRRLPREVLDAARVDGSRPLGIWAGVAMPLVWPVTLAVAALAFVACWSSFLEPLIYLYDAEKYTLPLGLRSLSVLGRENLPLLLAGAAAATAPVVLALLPLHRVLRRMIA